MVDQSQTLAPCAKVRRKGSWMLELDDACLCNIFSRLTPLPDLFCVSRTCKRFRDLASDGRMWLLVSTEAGAGRRLSASGRHCRCLYPTLAAAVAASRPGDTIIIEPGEAHWAQDVVIPWPLHLLGGGDSPESTVLTCPKGADAGALDFRATAKLANLTVRATMGACVMHRRGRLSVESCLLRCDAGGLDHLFTPLVTVATERGANSANRATTRASGQPAMLPPPAAFSPMPTAAMHCSAAHTSVHVGKIGSGGACKVAAAVLGLAPLRRPAQGLASAPDAASGILSVVETKIRGGSGSLAVRCGGTGALQSVRIINLSKDTLYWFHVDSTSPGHLMHSLAADRPFARTDIKADADVAEAKPHLSALVKPDPDAPVSSGQDRECVAGYGHQLLGSQHAMYGMASQAAASGLHSDSPDQHGVDLRRKARDWEQLPRCHSSRLRAHGSGVGWGLDQQDWQGPGDAELHQAKRPRVL